MEDSMNIEQRLKQIEQQIQTAKSNALRFYDDGAEVAIQYQIIDELLDEKAALILIMSESLASKE